MGEGKSIKDELGMKNHEFLAPDSLFIIFSFPVNANAKVMKRAMRRIRYMA